jgi:hypothetical protein
MAAIPSMRDALRSEGRLLYAAFVGAAKRGFVWVGGASLALMLYALVTGDIETSSAAEWLLVALVGFGYAVFLGGCAGLAFGVLRLLWFMVGGWIALPFVTVPLFAWLAVWLLSDFLYAQLADVGNAMLEAGADHEWVTGSIGPAARIGPVILVVALPLLVIDLGAIILDPRVLWQIAIMALDVGLVITLGAIVPLVASSIVLVAVYVRRFRRRHATGA